MMWWLQILAQYATSTGLAVLCIFLFWAYSLAFGRTYSTMVSAALAMTLLLIAGFPHGVDFALSKQALSSEGSEFLLFIADASGVITAVVIASFFFSPERVLDEA
ncbi:hypothetical protein [Pseudomonas putida]